MRGHATGFVSSTPSRTSSTRQATGAAHNLPSPPRHTVNAHDRRRAPSRARTPATNLSDRPRLVDGPARTAGSVGDRRQDPDLSARVRTGPERSRPVRRKRRQRGNLQVSRAGIEPATLCLKDPPGVMTSPTTDAGLRAEPRLQADLSRVTASRGLWRFRAASLLK